MKPAKQEAQDCPRKDPQPRRRSITVRLSRKVKLVYTWRARRRLPGLLLRLLTQAFASILAGWSAHAIAAPQGGNVVSGSATISNPSSSQTVIKQSTARAAIDWNSYSVAAGERVTYQQPTASSVTLNRVIGGDLSKIYGSIDANGVVVISNPAGIYFGQGAQVNVGGLVASGMAISNADFNAGNYRFSGSGGSVKNDGSIQAGAFGVSLIGHTVDNSGRIESGGAVLLGAGGAATLRLANDKLVDIAVDTSAVQAQVSNQGVIHADGSNIVLSARATDALLDTVLLAGGEMRADSLREVNGKIVLDGGSSGVVKVEGTLQARGLNAGEKGGAVTVTGERILLASNSLIDASGQAGGGQVHVGGGYQGLDPAIAHATDVVMQPGASIAADATVKGDGGEVVLWSDHGTAFGGSISAKGGAEGGDGGRVETSGHYLVATGSVNATAPKGRAGSWLLDPYDVTINNGGTDSMFDYDNGVITAVVDSTYLNANELSTSLSQGVNITVSTGVGGSQAGNISLLGSITKNSGATTTLTLQAAGQIYMGTSGRIAGGNGSALNVSLQAGSAVNMDTGSSIDTRGGTLGVSGTDVGLNNVQTSGGNISVNANGSAALGNVLTGTNLTGYGGLDVTANSISLANVTSGILNLTAAAGIGQTGKITTNDVTTIDAGNSDVTLNQATNSFGDKVKITNANNVSLANNGGLMIEGGMSGNLEVKANGLITQFNALSVQGNTSLDASGNDILLGAPTNAFTGAVSIQNANNVTLVSNQKVSIDGAVGGNLDLRAQGIDQINALTVAGTTSLTAGTGNDIDLRQAGNGFAGAVTIQSARDVTLNNVGDLALSGTVENDLFMRTAGATIFGNLTVKGDLSAASRDGFSQTGGLGVFGDALLNGAITINPASSNFVLGNSSNDLRGTVTLVRAHNVLLNNSGPLKLAGTVDGNLTVGSSGAITQGDVLTVGGDLALNAGTNADITLATAGNDFQGRVALQSVRNAEISSKALQLEGTVSGDLTATATTGSLTQGGALNVSGKSALAAYDRIVLDNISNSFTGPVDLQTTVGDAMLVAAGDLKFTANVANGLDLTASGALTQGNGPVNVSNGYSSLYSDVGVDVSGAGNVFGGALDVWSQGAAAIAGHVKGNLSVNAHGNISQGSQGQALIVDGQTTLNEQDTASSIDLSNDNNVFTGRIAAYNAPGRDTKISSASDVTLEGQVGNLVVKAAGSIMQSDAISATSADLTASGANHDIILDNAGNTLSGTVAFNATRDVTLVNAGALNVSGSAGGKLQLTTSTGAITQAGALSVGGTSLLQTQGNGDAITLSEAGNDFGGNALIVSAGSVELAGSFHGLHTLANGSITNSKFLNIDGAIALTTQAPGQDINLNASKFGDEVSLNAAGKVDLTSAAGVALSGSVTGALTVNAVDAITQGQSGSLMVGGKTTLKSTAGSIALGDVNNNLSGSVSFDGRDVTLVNAGALDVSGTASGNLSLRTTSGAITQGNALTVGGTTSLTTQVLGDKITLDNAGNALTGAVTIQGAGDVTLNNSQNLKLGGSASQNLTTQVTGSTEFTGLTVSGKLDASSSAGISQTGLLGVAGTSTLDAGGSDIALGLIQFNQPGPLQTNQFGDTITLSNVRDASITGSNGLKLEGQVGRDLMAVTYGGNISQNGALQVGRQTIVTSWGGGDITLDNSANRFTGSVNASGHDVTLQSATDLALGGGVSGKLDVFVGNASITTSTDALVVLGTSILGAKNISLTNADNRFQGNVEVSSTLGDVSLVSKGSDLKIAGSVNRNLTLDVTDGSIKQGTYNVVVTGTSDLTTRASSNAVPAPGIDLNDSTNHLVGAVKLNSAGDARLVSDTDLKLEGTVGGMLTAQAGGSITQTNALSTGNGATLTASGIGQDIILDNAGNTLSGIVSLNAGQDATLVNAGALNVSGTVGRDLGITTSTGSITQADALTVGRTTTLTTQGQGGDIQLTTATNNFTGAVHLSSAGNASLKAASGIMASGSTSGDLDINAGGTITQDGAFTVGGKTSLSAGADIAVNADGNTFGQKVVFSSPGTVSIASAGNLILEGSADDVLTVRATGSIGQSGSLTAQAASSFQSSNQGITLDRHDNMLAGPVSFYAPGDVTVVNNRDTSIAGHSGGKLVLESAGALTQATSSAFSATDFSLSADGAASLSTTGAGKNIAIEGDGNYFAGATTLASTGDVSAKANFGNSLTVQAPAGKVKLAGNVRTNLDVNAGDTISQGGSLGVSGATHMTAANGIDLSQSGNSFGAVTLDSGNGAATISGHVAGDLGITSLNGIYQGAEALTVDGKTSLTMNGAPLNARIDLSNADNRFTGVFGLNTDGSATIKSAGNLQLEGSVSDLTVVAAGSITQGSNPLVVTNSADLSTTGVNHDITLANAGNDFRNQVTLTTSAGNATISSISDFHLKGEVQGNLDATALAASILQGTGPVIVHGDTRLTTTASNTNHPTDIILERDDNAFYGQLILNSAGRAIVHGFGTMRLSGTVAQSLEATANGGSLLQGSGPLTVGTSSSFTTVDTGNQQPTNISFTNPANSFGGPVTVNSAGDATLVGAGNLDVSGTVAGDTTLVATGNLGASGTFAGDANLTAGGNLGLSGTVGGDATLAAGGNLDLSGTITGKLDAQAGGNITQGAPLEVGSTTQLAAGGNIDLSNPANDFTGSVTVTTAANVSIADRNDLQSSGQTSGQLDLSAGGDLTQSGAWQVGGDTQLNAGNNVQFDNPANQLTGPVSVTAGNDASVSASNPVTVDANVGGDLTVTAPSAQVGGNVGGDLSVVGTPILLPTLVVGGSNGALNMINAIQRALAANLSMLSDNGPGSYRKYLMLANPPVSSRGNLLPTIEGSGILLPEEERRKAQSSQ